jgi:hypothetical protein
MQKIDKIIFADFAIKDLELANNFYQNQNFYDFKTNILKEIKTLKHSSGIHKKYFGLFCMLSEKFPYAIYYKTTKNFCVIVAILDLRQQPNFIFNTLENR